MADLIQWLLVGLAILVALAYVVRRAAMSLSLSSGAKCAAGCRGCGRAMNPKEQSPDDRVNGTVLVELSTRHSACH